MAMRLLKNNILASQRIAQRIELRIAQVATQQSRHISIQAAVIMTTYLMEWQQIQPTNQQQLATRHFLRAILP